MAEIRTFNTHSQGILCHGVCQEKGSGVYRKGRRLPRVSLG